MTFTQKIYLNNKPLILTNSAEQFTMKNPASVGYLFLKGAFVHNFRLAKKHLETPHSLGVVIDDVSPAALQKELHEAFIPTIAGGGVVTDPAGQVLMIYRRGKWDLPKGKQDEGETIAHCAQREVTEETGLAELLVGDKICETYHVYTYGIQDLLKITHWFQMKVSKTLPLYPQKEENITEARWVPEQELTTYLQQSYEAIKEVLTAAGKKWA
jgi:8-oxo-dGTP pyrophosphatase MutT (NUDIX family)